MFDHPQIKITETTGPHGDATCWYKAEVVGDLTMREFIAYVAHDYAVRAKEWGTIEIAPMRGYEGHVVEYKGFEGPNGTAWLYAGEHWMDSEQRNHYLENSTTLYNKYIDREIVSVRANGGWGAMDYYLDFGPEPVSYANYEF